MTIDRLSGPIGAGAPLQGNMPDARSLAASTIGEIGHRVLAWVGASVPGGDAGAAQWSQAAGGGSGFRPDAGELARRGDVYGLDSLAADVSGQLGGTPTQEGALRRALTDFTRAAAVQVAGLAGAPERQTAGLGEALGVASGADAPNGVDGVIDRIEAATRSLEAGNAG